MGPESQKVLFATQEPPWGPRWGKREEGFGGVEEERNRGLWWGLVERNRGGTSCDRGRSQHGRASVLWAPLRVKFLASNLVIKRHGGGALGG